MTGSYDKTLCVWDLKDGAVLLKKMEGDYKRVMAVAVSGDGKIIASGDEDGKLIALDHLPSSSPHWDGDTQAGECLAEGMKPHANGITSRVEAIFGLLCLFTGPCFFWVRSHTTSYAQRSSLTTTLYICFKLHRESVLVSHRCICRVQFLKYGCRE